MPKFRRLKNIGFREAFRGASEEKELRGSAELYFLLCRLIRECQFVGIGRKENSMPLRKIHPNGHSQDPKKKALFLHFAGLWNFLSLF
ncbi:hypothetical protein JWG45_12755 [Leptospira sp. 201903070]|uniref:DUF1564 family protein n=1 Tax=Leptospira ainlahdjerensis TaxID=2810033 RepID=A0ABS2UCY8_9LEPT|nr:hypothetical protein [Leptospira ainlahdjerensis]MBM9578019.1 hypothetical protein [Leptospira ainlahdjerensis]